MRRRNAFLLTTTTLGVFTAFTFVRTLGVGMSLPTYGRGALAQVPSVFFELLPGGIEIEFGRLIGCSSFEFSVFPLLPAENPGHPCLLPRWTSSGISLRFQSGPPTLVSSTPGSSFWILTDSHTLTLPFWPFIAGLLLAWWRPWKRRRPAESP